MACTVSADDPPIPAIDAILMILPPRPWAIMTFPAAWVQRNVPVRLVSITLFQSARPIFSVGAPHEIPALLISTSIRPKSETVASTACWTLAGSFTSHDNATVLTPRCFSSSADCWLRYFLRALSDTLSTLSARLYAEWCPTTEMHQVAQTPRLM